MDFMCALVVVQNQRWIPALKGLSREKLPATELIQFTSSWIQTEQKSQGLQRLRNGSQCRGGDSLD